MNKICCYLVGPIQAANDSGEGWRKKYTPSLESLGIKVLNPNKIEKEDLHHSAAYTQKQLANYIFNEKWAEFDSIMSTIQDRDFKAVRVSDFLIAYLDPDVKYGGTVAEIERARSLGIPVFVVCEKELHRENFWVIYTIRDSGGKIFKSFPELIDYLSQGIKSGVIKCL
jgi:nucleoside 2-deoxyribosyltransferase